MPLSDNCISIIKKRIVDEINVSKSKLTTCDADKEVIVPADLTEKNNENELELSCDSYTVKRFRKLQKFDDNEFDNSSVGSNSFLQFLEEVDVSEEATTSLTNFKNRKSLEIQSQLDTNSSRPILYNDVVKSSIKENDNFDGSGIDKQSPRSPKPKIYVSAPYSPKPGPVIDSEGFQLKQSRAEIKRQQFENKFKLIGAPLPTANIWVHRVKEGNEYSITKYIKSRNIEVHNVIKKSNVNSKFMSYMVNIDKKDLHVLLNDKFWPKGVKAKIWRNKSVNENKSRSFTNYRYRN